MSTFQEKIKHLGHLKWACRGVILLATAVSVWANILHSERDVVSIIINALPPLIVLAGFELISRIPIPEGTPWYMRWSRLAGVVGVSGIGAWLSYWHQNAAFLRYAKDVQTANLLPLSIDGLMIIASVSLIMLNQKMTELQARELGLSVRTAKPKVPETSTKKQGTAPLTVKEKISLVLRDTPDLPIKQIAEKVGTGYNNAHAIVKQIRAAQAAEEAMAA
jgi:hypothetical protein